MIDTCGPRFPGQHDDLPVLAARSHAKVAGRAMMVLRCLGSGGKSYVRQLFPPPGRPAKPAS